MLLYLIRELGHAMLELTIGCEHLIKTYTFSQVQFLLNIEIIDPVNKETLDFGDSITTVFSVKIYWIRTSVIQGMVPVGFMRFRVIRNSLCLAPSY